MYCFTRLVFLAFFASCIAWAAFAQNVAAGQISLSEECVFDRSPTGKGEQKLALLVGISDYKVPEITRLPGTQQDLASMQSLLTDEDFGLGFSTANICILRNQDASLENVLRAFQLFIIDRVDESDRVLFFFAGHGGQKKDTDGAEPDGLDETLVFYDTLAPVDSGGEESVELVPHLTDDVVGELLRVVSLKLSGEATSISNNLIVIIDACNSQTVSRSNYTERSVSADFAKRLSPTTSYSYAPLSMYLQAAGVRSNLEDVDGGESLQSIAPTGAVFISAASDGYSAYEYEGKGLFTTALVEAMASSRKGASFEVIEARTRDLMRTYNQIPSFQGAVDFRPFTSDRESTNLTHRVSRIMDGNIELSGPPLLGLGPGAEFRVYGNGVENDPTAVLEVVDSNLLRPTAMLINGDVPEVGASAVMISVSPNSRLLSVSIERTINADLATRIKNAQANNPDAQLGFVFHDSDGSNSIDMKLGALPGGGAVLSDAAGNIRKTFEPGPRLSTEVTKSLTGFARQKSLRQLRGEGGAALFDDYSVKLNLIPVTKSGPSRCRSDYEPFDVVKEISEGKWRAPICSRWQFQVEGVDIDRELQVAVLVLSNDGSVYVLPGRQGDDARISPASPTFTFSKVEQTFQALPPIGATDEYLVFAVDAKTPIPWWSMSLPSGARSALSNNRSKLFSELNRYMAFGSRNSGPVVEPGDLSVWSVSKAELELVVNPDFADVESALIESGPTKREYTIQGFDIRPYLPSNTNSTLYKVLERASYLSTQSDEFIPTDEDGEEESAGQGFPYKQHDWCQADANGRLDFVANLELGIDCSRSIWYAFTQAGLPYAGQSIGASPRNACLPYRSDGNDYLTTADMVGPSTPLSEDFTSCAAEDLQIGDVLVYRDEDRGVGHTVMVIDPEKRIAWGSHGWDGNKRFIGHSDTGVEFQKIKIKQDWQRWDSPGMKLKACWRHNAFIDEGTDRLWSWRGALSFLLCPDGQRCFARSVGDAD